MKKIAIAVLSAVCVFALAGCADDVTMDNEQNDIVAEYIAGTLLRHSYANEWKYSKLSNPTFNKSGQSTTTTGKNNTTGTTAANKQTTTAVGQTGTTSTTGTTQAGIKAASITEALGLSGVTVSYKKVSVGDRYPIDAYAVCVPADSGCKVVAVEFTIKNTGSAVYTGTTAANKQTTTAVGQTGTTSTTGTTQAGIKAASITEALGLSGVTVSYKKVSVGDRYPIDAYAVCVPADSGCKVVAVEFTIKNTGSAVYTATTKSANVTMKLSAGSGTYTQYKSMLKNDICNLDKVTINAGEEYTAAAVFQVSTTDAGASGMKLEVLSGTQQQSRG